MRNKPSLYSGFWLAITLLAITRLDPDTGITLRAALVAIVAALLAPVPVKASSAAGLRRWVFLLPARAAVAVCVAALWFVWIRPSTLVYLFIPIWLLLTVAQEVGAPWALVQLKRFRRIPLGFLRSVPAVLESWLVPIRPWRLDVLLADSVLIGIVLIGGERLQFLDWPGAFPATAIALWILIHVTTRFHLKSGLSALSLPLAILIGALLLDIVVFADLSRSHLVVLAWLAVGLVLLRLLRAAAAPGGLPSPSEHFRWSLLAIAVFWLFRPFLQPQLHGAGDANWYGVMLADMIQQVRSGVFPVFVGQSEFQFDGAIYPIRIAPAFHYLGALLDQLTLRALGVYAVQNLLIALTGTIALGTCYATLADLLPRHRGSACLLAILFLTCPGVFGLAFVSDLYMSWTTLPFAPLAIYATVRSFRKGDRFSLLPLGISLGSLWWGHSPIALWFTALAGAAQIVRVVLKRPAPREWRHMAAAAGIFLAIVAYPVGSVLLFPPEPGVDAAGFQEAIPSTMAPILRDTFPAMLLPISATGRFLADLQPGYALLGVLGFVLLALARRFRPEPAILAAAALGLLMLLIPIPGVTQFLWGLVPPFIRNPTGNWPMNRLYLPFSAGVVFAAAAVIGDRDRKSILTVLMLSVACAWSLSEAWKFEAGSRLALQPAASAGYGLWSENVAITRFSYLVFPKLPDTFTHGVTRPELENRLRSLSTNAVIATNYDAARAHGSVAATGTFVRSPGNAAILRLDTSLRLDPGRQYLLEVSLPPATQGTLRLSGETFSRVYALPDYGEARSFGLGGEHRDVVPVWTSSPQPESIDVAVLDTVEGPGAGNEEPGMARLLAYDRGDLTVRVESWISYRARVTAPEACWLETPRMYQVGYVAQVNGRDATVSKSPEGLVSVRVPEGNSEVTLQYQAPAGLRALWWLSLPCLVGGWIAIGVRCGIRVARRPAVRLANDGIAAGN